MSDDENATEAESTTLASLYVDDAATSDERALVETSTDTLSEVAELSELRTVLAATAPTASLSAREGHLANALDVWERMSDGERAGDVTPRDGIDATAAAAVSTPSTGMRAPRSGARRRLAGLDRRQWLLGAAAALTVVAGIGFVVRELATDSAVDTNQVADEIAPAESLTPLDDLEAAEAAEVNGENVGADAVPTETDLSDDAATSGAAPVEESAADAGAGDGTLPGQEQPAPPPDEAIVAIDNAEDLAIYASFAVRALETGDATNEALEFEPAFGTCEAELGVEEELEPVIYAGIPVVVGVDLDNDVVLAYTAEDCAVVESVALTE